MSAFLIMGAKPELFKLTLTIHGRVQGVFFREETCNFANKLGLVGLVENLDDGTVQVVAEGPKVKLDELKAWCEGGPELAKVEEVSEKFEAIDRLTYNGFNCIYH